MGPALRSEDSASRLNGPRRGRPSDLPAGALGLVPELLQLGGDPVAVVALDFDPPVLDRPAGAALLLEEGGQLAQTLLAERQLPHDRHALPAAAGRLAADLHR